MNCGAIITVRLFFCYSFSIAKSIWSCTYYWHQIIKTENHPSRFPELQSKKKNKLSIDGWFLIACQKMRNRIDSRFWAFWHLNAAKVKSFMKICWTLEIDCVWQHFNIPFGRLLLLLLLLSSLIAAAFAFLGVEFSHS